ncbi:hypothetical protein MLD38_025609 [Melastoma candidum]|uniref:Uncharacterized protein n=1 Tax=Melastoma candidum TaxID=119954 RepID=A0ACB9NXH3_9MYRT|nr:hypothetical protein MLD38_025609 [Melastoma candidum]
MSASMTGAITTTTNPFYTPIEILKQLKASNAKLIITQSQHVDKLLSFSDNDLWGDHLSFPIVTMDDPLENCLHFSVLNEANEEDAPKVDVDPDRPAALPFLSGMTGPPKINPGGIGCGGIQSHPIEAKGRRTIPKMMRLQTYAGLSLLGTLAVIYHAFGSRGQFYPAMVYLSTSKINLVLLLNMGLVLMCVLWQLTKRLFLGSLREAEVERLNEQSWREVMEILFAITIFRQDLSVSFLAMVTTLLLIKSLHWLAQKRVEYIETTPTVPMLSHLRIVSFMGFLLILDSLFLYSFLKFLIETRQASVSLFFAFEYMILATTTVSTFIKYVFYVSDMLMEGQWERKAVYTFYLELVRDLLHLSLYMCFFLVIFMNYGVPLHLIRELYETFRNFKIRVADYIRYRKITSNMNDRFPDATPEELNASDATCIICREEMTTAKKLVCGHLFHVHCLRSWLERQHTCPTCRALVVPPESGTSTAAGHAQQSDFRPQATAAMGSSSQGQADGELNGNNLSRHQARIQAAGAAAAVYEKSFVYPSRNTLTWSPGYAYVPQVSRPLSDSSTGESSVQQDSLDLRQLFVYVPYHNPNASPTSVERSEQVHSMSQLQLEANERVILRQIETLQKQLENLRNVNAGGRTSGSTMPEDHKGKSVLGSPRTVAGATSDGDDLNPVGR